MYAIVLTGKGDAVKELATSKYIDIARACALGIANRQWDPNAAARQEETSYLEVREGNKTLYRVVLKRDQARWVIE